MTNGEVAKALFVSRKTVEFHLGRIYRKPGYGRGPNSAVTLHEPTEQY